MNNWLEIERNGGVTTLWLNRPDRHNAFDEHLIAALDETLGALDADPAVRVVVLAGRGESFCAGGDLDWMRRMATVGAERNLADAQRLAIMLQRLYRMSKPTIARVHGAARAGGVGLVAACDIALASVQANFAISEVRLGLSPAAIAPYLLRALGERTVRRYLLTGERIDAQKALELGLVHERVSADALDSCVADIADTLLAGAPAALAAAKRLLADVAGRPLDAMLMAETAQRIATARAGHEAQEGIAAFKARRKPLWS